MAPILSRLTTIMSFSHRSDSVVMRRFGLIAALLTLVTWMLPPALAQERERHEEGQAEVAEVLQRLKHAIELLEKGDVARAKRDLGALHEWIVDISRDDRGRDRHRDDEGHDQDDDRKERRRNQGNRQRNNPDEGRRRRNDDGNRRERRRNQGDRRRNEEEEHSEEEYEEEMLHELRAAVEAGKITREQAREKLQAYRQQRAEKNGRGRGQANDDQFVRRIRAAVAAGELSREHAREKIEGYRKEQAKKNQGRGGDRRGPDAEVRRRDGRAGPNDTERQLEDLRRQVDDIRRKYDELIDRLRSMRQDRGGR